MELEFDDDDLRAIETDEAGSLGLSIAVIKSARRKLILLRSAPDERTLRNWKSLHYEKLSGKREGQRSIRLNDQWRLVFKLLETTPPKILVIEIVDYHH